ncbi:hypothetical protein GCM10023144_06680 [Pigmentiphaga soli]|uniref:DUF2970 domain-containing protein n=1 Tax=Pigmentiphaga soli TaxID=1007095 RepID=A0ABP8GI97_9BURK
MNAPGTRRKMGFFQTVAAVAWSFIGLRSGKESRDDLGNYNPLYLVIIGLLLAAAFVVILLLIVRSVVS